MVAEKPSLAASLATILSNGRQSTRKGECWAGTGIFICQLKDYVKTG